MNVLSGIMNPAVADPVGGFQRGQQARQNKLTDDMLKEMYGARLSGKLGELAELDPDKAMLVADAFQIPVGREDRQRAFLANITLLSGMLKGGVNPRDAGAYLAEEIAFLNETEGVNAPLYAEILQDLSNPQTAPAGAEKLFTLENALIAQGILKDPEGKEPDSIQALRIRAREGGLKEGTPDYRDFMRQNGASTGGPKDQRDRKIAQYQDVFGLSLEDAIQATDSQTMMDDKGNAIVFNPVTRKTELLNPAPETRVNLRTPTEGAEVEDLAFDPGKGTGIAAAFLNLYNSTLGQVPFLPTSTDTTEAGQNLRVLGRDAIRALASSGRPPVIEQQRIESIIPKGMDPFENPDEARFKMTNFIDLMTQQFIDDLRYVSDPRNPKRLREESGRRAKEIESVIRRTLQPEAADQLFRSINGVEAETSDLRLMSTEELLNIDPASLSPAQNAVYIELLENL